MFYGKVPRGTINNVIDELQFFNKSFYQNLEKKDKILKFEKEFSKILNIN